MNIYSIRDDKTGAYNTPFFAENDIYCQRIVGMMVADKRTQLNHYPADFTLYRIGDFDNKTGLIISHEPMHICNCIQLVNKQKVEEK